MGRPAGRAQRETGEARVLTPPTATSASESTRTREPASRSSRDAPVAHATIGGLQMPSLQDCRELDPLPFRVDPHMLEDLGRAHSRFPGHALTPTGVMAIRCKQFHLPDL